MEHPFHIELCEDSKKTVLIFLLIYGLGIGVALIGTTLVPLLSGLF